MATTTTTNLVTLRFEDDRLLSASVDGLDLDCSSALASSVAGFLVWSLRLALVEDDDVLRRLRRVLAAAAADAVVVVVGLFRCRSLRSMSP